ncbi:hypothetical protein EYF80_026828 [Liparis tanakae]|uniref:Uncharacterized protein n=1 Tax=Liparis tanakae TaxID=230148 RepID=A0A4Z2HAP1_9TELE|nr:hypothetical protein EYF80_026828 [Liparis tanakae]
MASRMKLSAEENVPVADAHSLTVNHPPARGIGSCTADSSLAPFHGRPLKQESKDSLVTHFLSEGTVGPRISNEADKDKLQKQSHKWPSNAGARSHDVPVGRRALLATAFSVISMVAQYSDSILHFLK